MARAHANLKVNYIAFLRKQTDGSWKTIWSIVSNIERPRRLWRLDVAYTSGKKRTGAIIRSYRCAGDGKLMVGTSIYCPNASRNDV